MKKNFFAELIARLFSKNPFFFKVIQIISIAVAFVTGLPALLTESGVNLPDWATALESKIAGIAAVIAAIIAQLPKDEKPTT